MQAAAAPAVRRGRVVQGAKALRALDFQVHHVGEEGQPPKNSSDEEILAFAQKTRQVIVTSNHDMIMLCAERGASVVWLDPHRRRLRLDEQASMAFEGIVQWCALLTEATGPVCLRVLRTRVHVLPIDEGAALAEKRYRAIKRRKAQQRARQPTPIAQMSTDDISPGPDSPPAGPLTETGP